MSLSSIPSALSAARTWVIDSAAAWRAALAVLRSIRTPRLIVARSGTTVTLPLPVTAMVCSGGWSVAFTAAAYRGCGARRRAERGAGDEADREGRHAGDRHPAEGRAAGAASGERGAVRAAILGVGHRRWSTESGPAGARHLRDRCVDRWVPLPGRPGARRRWVPGGFRVVRSSTSPMQQGRRARARRPSFGGCGLRPRSGRCSSRRRPRRTCRSRGRRRSGRCRSR